MRISLNDLSKYRSQIYGFAIIWIAFFHGSINTVDYSFGNESLLWLKTIMGNGSVGVEVFLFLSGISLYFSYRNNPDLLSYLKKRAKRVFIPLFLIDGVYFFIRFFIIEHERSACISSLMLLKFWETGDQTTWFASLIMVLYIIYPYLFSILFEKDDNKSVWLRGVIILLLTYLAIICFYRVNYDVYSMVEIAVTRVPVFILGSIVGKYVYEKKTISALWIIPILILPVLFFYVPQMDVLHDCSRRLFFIVGGIPITFLLAEIFKFTDKISNRLLKHDSPLINRAFGFAGAASLEFYYTHI